MVDPDDPGAGQGIGPGTWLAAVRKRVCPKVILSLNKQSACGQVLEDVTIADGKESKQGRQSHYQNDEGAVHALDPF